MERWTMEQYEAHQRRVRGHTPRADVSAPPFKMPGNEAGRFALGRLPLGTMNKTEKAYADYLTCLKHAGEVAWFEFEGMKFRLADKTFYTPDFNVLLPDNSMEMHEVKGFWEDDARVKIKVAAAKYPFRFIGVTARSKKKGGGWEREEFA